MRKLILTLAVVLGITAACEVDHIYHAPDVYVTIDNSNTNNANIEIANTSENWQDCHF